MTLGAWWRGYFLSHSASLVKASIRSMLPCSSQGKYQRHAHNHWIGESAAETAAVFSVEYCEVSRRGLYPGDECETRIRWQRYSIWEHRFYLGLSGWNGKCQKGGEQRQHLNRKMRSRMIDHKAEADERGTPRHTQTHRDGERQHISRAV